MMENGEARSIMNRVDMDALPILEENRVPYASKSPGRMHACGHDAHSAIGLGIATIMAQHRDAWQGTLKLIFQPGEEGQNGAEIMVREGRARQTPASGGAGAPHGNTRPYGKISAAPGTVMAAGGGLQGTINGRGGHGALPEKTIDAVIIAALMVTNLQTIISRNARCAGTAVLTIGSIQCGDAFNVIPETAELRARSAPTIPRVRARVLDRLQAIIHGTAEMMGATADLQMMPVTPALVNDRSVTALVQDVARDLFGPESLDITERTMGSEDAAFFLQEVPGCYVFVASGPEDYETRPHHSPRFDIDERALINGVGLNVETLCRLLPVRWPERGCHNRVHCAGRW